MDYGNKWDQAVWDSGYENADFGHPAENDQIQEWIDHWLTDVKPGSCLEVGCFPGRYLAAFGKKGYVLNGVDLTPQTDPQMKTWLQKQGYALGSISKSDFFQFSEEKKYDVVYSNGFVEHFTDWKPVVEKHMRLVAPGGLLLISAPNFKGWFQHLLHSLLDSENLERHYVPSMDPVLWKTVIEKADFEILDTGYFPGFHFWVGEQKRNPFQKLAFWALRALIPALRRVLPKNSPTFAPYCGVVARRKSS